MVFLVRFKVLGQLGDALRQECYLNLSRACVAFVASELTNNLFSTLSCNRHVFQPPNLLTDLGTTEPRSDDPLLPNLMSPN